MSPVCLFCRKSGSFTTREHIVPESLGNDSDVLTGIVCDQCQNYFSHSLEKPALEKTPFAFWRTFLGTRSKKGKLPFVDLEVKPQKFGVPLPSFHPLTDPIGFTSHIDGSTSVEINNTQIVREILEDKKQSFQIVLSPWHLSIIGRFLGKMGLEFLALADIAIALKKEFDPLRNFVRYGSTRCLWPIFMGQADSGLQQLRKESTETKYEVECYRYSLGVVQNDDYVFAFGIGTDLYLISLSSEQPNEKFRNLIAGATLTCVHYPTGSW